ncbi:MAG: trypsin-like peptidase domain-containing protein [Betaproteobacteria bacterium]|nr:trypsin-like peptidase domain-containing protein [Betaproteobacteria bacterium]
MKSRQWLALSSLLVISQLASLPLAGADGVGPYYKPIEQEEAAQRFAIDAVGPGNAFAENSRLKIRLPVPTSSELETLRRNNTKSASGQAKALQIGFGRDMPSNLRLATTNIPWVALADGRLATQLQLTSPGAKALRVGLAIKPGFAGELRFAGSDKPQMVLGPYRQSDWRGQPIFWSPVVEGDTVTVEIVLPGGQKGLNGDIEIVQVSHIAANPSQGNQFSNLSPDTYSCEVDLECSTNSVVKTAAKGVARMVYVKNGGKSYVCSGTLLNDKGGTQTPWFYTAHHCISDQTVATTLNTYFFYENSGCYTNNVPKTYKQLTRGATYLDSDATNDHAFLRLNEAAPSGVVFNAWSTVSLASGQDIVGIHHPHGDLKKVSLGLVSSPATASILSSDTGQRLNDLWSVSYYSGAVEPGSSGSGLFSCSSTSCDLRGGLFGGSDNPSCSYGIKSAYSRFDVAYNRIAGYLSPTTTSPAPTPTPTTKTASSRYANGVLTINNLEIDNGAAGKVYYNVTMKLKANSNPALLELDSVTQSP